MTDLKPGDRVTSPLLVGEWTVDVVSRSHRVDVRAPNLCDVVDVPASTLTRVPPKVTEPPVGSVVWAQDQSWIRTDVMSDCGWTNGLIYNDWPDLVGADDLSPVVPVLRVAEWLDDYHLPLPSRQLIPALHDEFGWPEDGAE